jgi:arabinan endo-1,5-alpha-L-arabinosidase
MYSILILLLKEKSESLQHLTVLYSSFLLLITTLAGSADNRIAEIEPPVFKDVSVHDPSVLKIRDTFWVIGSHLASAYSTDLIKWTQYTPTVAQREPLIPNVIGRAQRTFTWLQSRACGRMFCAIDNGKYYMYYCSCEAVHHFQLLCGSI